MVELVWSKWSNCPPPPIKIFEGVKGRGRPVLTLLIETSSVVVLINHTAYSGL